MSGRAPDRVRDVCILAGGPAGLACAVRAAALGLDAAVLCDPAARRTAWAGKVLAHFAFPEGISGRALLERGRAQVEAAGGELIEGVALDARARGDGGFDVRVRGVVPGDPIELTARALVLAEEPPDVPPALATLLAQAGIAPPAALAVEDTDLAGRALVVLAADAIGLEAALAALEIGARPLVVVPAEAAALDAALDERIRAAGVRVVAGPLEAVERDGDGRLAALVAGGERLEVERLAVVPARRVSIDVGAALGVDLVEGYAACDGQRRTSVQGVYLADGGPSWRPVLEAEAAGARAAQAAWLDLRNVLA